MLAALHIDLEAEIDSSYYPLNIAAIHCEGERGVEVIRVLLRHHVR